MRTPKANRQPSPDSIGDVVALADAVVMLTHARPRPAAERSGPASRV